MKIEHLECLIEVANSKSINKAANNLYMAQPALSSLIASIEKELGFPIFYRYNRGVEVTAQGMRVIDDAKNMLNMYYNWKSFSENTMEIHDHVNIVAPWITCSLFLPRNILNLRKLYPDLAITTFEMPPQAIMEQIYSGNNLFSLGIIYMKDSEKTKILESLNHAKIPWNADLLYQDEDVLCISKNSPYYNNDELSREMLSNMTLLKYSTPNRPPIDIDLFGFKSVLEAGSPEQILSMVAGSDLVALLPASWMNSNFLVKPDTIKFFYLDEIYGLENVKQNTGNYVIYKSMNRLSPAEKIVLKELKSNFAPLTDSY